MKKIKYLVFILICNLLLIVNVNAAGATITARSSASQVQVGQTFTVTVTVSSSTALGSWQFNVGYDSNTFTYVSSTLESGLSSAGFVSNANTKNKQYTLTFKAKAAGTGKISVNNVEVYSFDENVLSASGTSTSVTVVNPSNTSTSNKTSNKTTTSNSTSSNQNSNSNTTNKSANNYLSSLSVDGYTISPTFNKNTTSYSVSVPNEVRNINIRATLDDKNASISGIGAKALVEGNNRFNIVVRAENGNTKTYTLNVKVLERNPIKVKVGDKEYTIVQKSTDISAPNNYNDTTVTIDGSDIPAFYNDITKYTLVGLTDNNGSTKLYIYKDDTYTLYNEYKFSGLTLFVKEPSSNVILNNTTEEEIIISGEKVKAYKLKDNSYPLIYGMNIETGEESWYTYDEKENTLQRFVVGNKNSSDDVKQVADGVSYIVDGGKYKSLSYILTSYIFFYKKHVIIYYHMSYFLTQHFLIVLMKYLFHYLFLII